MNKLPEPPKRAMRFLRWFCREDFLEEVEGDLWELFERQAAEHPAKARRAFRWGVLRHFRPAFIRAFSSNPYFLAMFRHNLLISYRGFLRNKTFFFVNLIGLATGLAATILIYLWVQDERSVDAFHEKDAQLYKVMQHFDTPRGILTWDYSPLILGEALTSEFPEVLGSANANNGFHIPEGLMGPEGGKMPVQGAFVSGNYFQVFSYPMLIGQAASAFSDPRAIVLSAQTATKLFGSPSAAIGQELPWRTGFFDTTFLVSAVFEDIPSNSTKQFAAAVHSDWLIAEDIHAGEWNGDYGETYLLMQPGTDIAAFNTKIKRYYDTKSKHRAQFSLFVQRYSDQYLFGQYEGGKLTGGRITYVRLFSLVAFFILLIACINFMNLSTAQASRKMKEIGVKKAIGATRQALVGQFLTESMLLSALGTVLALGVVILALPHFNELTAKELVVNWETLPLWQLLSLSLLTGLLAGSYPAFFLSGFRPISVLKGRLRPKSGATWVRKGLVVFQFTLTVVFLISVWVIRQQIQFTQDQHLGYDRSHIITFARPSDIYQHEDFLARIRQMPGVVNAANMVWSILDHRDSGGGYSWRGIESDKQYVFRSPKVGYQALETLGLELVMGRTFSKEMGDDYTKIILNESAWRMMELENPVGTVLDYGEESREIIGVVKDFQYGSLHHKIEPMIIRHRRMGQDMMVKVEGQATQAVLADLESLYKEFHPEYPFSYSFLEEDYQRLYEAESRIGSLSSYASLLAIIIACLGLFGLATFNAESRSKEIGIRKVLGASVSHILGLLSTDYLRMVMLGFILAVPAAWFLMEDWLSQFAYHIGLNAWTFLGAGGLALLVALLTVGGLSLRVAVSNPVDALRDE